MMQEIVKIKSIHNVTHNVLRIVTEKPEGFNFKPGQATEISINKKGWESEKRPFTFTSLPDDDHLEFTIKTYPSHKGVTNELLNLKQGDELILHDIFGAIGYKGEGVFIAGGAGVTPFISIFRSISLKKQIDGNKLIFANAREEDIILREEFQELLGANFINILSEEKVGGLAHGFINADFLNENIQDKSKVIYLCGPEPMMDAVEKQLLEIGVSSSSIVKEEF